MEEHGLSDRKCGGQSETDPADRKDESRPGLRADRGQQEYALADRKGNGEPSLGVLGKITSGLRIEFQELIATPLVDSYLVTPENLVPTKELEGQYTVWTFFPYEDTRLVEIYRIDIEPGGTYVSGGHGEKTREYLVVTDGVMTVECNGKEHEIHLKQAFRFETDQTHIYRNRGTEKTSCMCFFLDYH